MKTHLSEEGLWADNLAARLRSLQASFADDPAATRVNFLAEEVERGELKVFRLLDRPPMAREFSIATLASRPLTPAESAFVATLTRCCAKHAAYAESCVGAVHA